MAENLAESPAPNAADSLPAWLLPWQQALNRLSNQQKIALMVTFAAIISVLVGLWLWGKQPDWKVLFSNLDDRDAGSIIEALDQQNIPYRVEDNGALLVHAERVHQTRLRLATQGLPKGGLVGFELMEKQKFGTSQFAEQVNYQRALEGELARTIQAISTVESARVHLAIPKPSVFIREDQKPSASVMVKLYPGRILDSSQIAGITHLISSSVPQLPNSSVTIVDQSGAILQQVKSKLAEAGLDPTQLSYVKEIEEGMVKRIEDILMPVFGMGNFKVQATADLDFSQNEQTAELYSPNAKPENASIRSQQSSETTGVNTTLGGVPGALTNQPPVPAIAPLVQPATANQPPQPPRALQPNESPGRINNAGIDAPLNPLGQPIGTNKSTTTNYEVDKTIRHTKEALGAIRRLTAAVVINYRKETDAEGKQKILAVPDEELKKIGDLVREAMGFNPKRGDSVSVVSSPFNDLTKEMPPLWKDPQNIVLGMDILKYLILAGIFFFLYLKVIKPALNTMFPPPPPPPSESEKAALAAESAATAAAAETVEYEMEFDDQGNIIGRNKITRRKRKGVEGEEDEEDEVSVEPDSYTKKLNKARKLASTNPQAVAAVVKLWMNGDGA